MFLDTLIRGILFITGFIIIITFSALISTNIGAVFLVVFIIGVLLGREGS